MNIRKRDVLWGITGVFLAATVVLFGVGEIIGGVLAAVAVGAIGWSAAGTGVSGAPLWLMPPSRYPSLEEAPDGAITIDDGYVPFADLEEEDVRGGATADDRADD